MARLLGQYLEAICLGRSASGKTERWAINNTTQGARLAVVEWNGRWRQYVVNVNAGTTWSAGCLRDVFEFLRELNAEHKAKGTPCA